VCIVDDIESAMRLSADEFKTKYGFMKPSPSGPPVIVYCRAGVRALNAAKVLTEQFGFTRFVLLSFKSRETVCTLSCKVTGCF